MTFRLIRRGARPGWPGTDHGGPGWFGRAVGGIGAASFLADVVPAQVYGRAYGFERAMDNLGAIAGPLLAIGLLAVVSIRTAMYLSVIPGLLAAAAIVYAIRRTATPKRRERQPVRVTVRPLLAGPLGRLLAGVAAFETGNCASTLLILRATDLFAAGHGRIAAAQLAVLLATVQAGGNLIASALAGLLWSAVSPLAAFVFLAAAMVIAAALITTAGPGSPRRAGDTRRKARPFPG